MKNISRRQFFGRATVGAVGIATIPFLPWDKLVKLAPKIKLEEMRINTSYSTSFRAWRLVYAGHQKRTHAELQWLQYVEDIVAKAVDNDRFLS